MSSWVCFKVLKILCLLGMKNPIYIALQKHLYLQILLLKMCVSCRGQLNVHDRYVFNIDKDGADCIHLRLPKISAHIAFQCGPFYLLKYAFIAQSQRFRVTGGGGWLTGSTPC